ncbi:MAG: amidohydrolase family protein [Candidatus Eisenbacteria bacterium]
MHTHAAETEEECAEVTRLTGRSPVGYLASLEGTAGRTCLAHAVWLSEEDRAALAGHDLAVCHCPSSNLKLGSGLADLAALRARGVRIGLGADGAACNNRLDPWQEMRQAAHVAALRSGPAAVDPRAILFEATEGAARAIGLGPTTTALGKGEAADFLVLDPIDPVGAAAFREEELSRSRKGRKADSSQADSERLIESPAALLVFAGSPSWVAETWVGGRRIHPAPETASSDLPERTARVRQRLRERITQTAR